VKEMAQGNSVGTISLNLNLNTNNFNSGLNGLSKNLSGLSGVITKVGGLVAAAFSVKVVADFGKECANAFSVAEQGAMKLYATLSGQSINFNSADSFITKFVEDGLVELGKAQEAYANLAQMGMSTEQIETMMQVMKDSAAVGRQSGYTIGQAMATATEGMRQGLSNKTDNVGITTNLSQMEEEYKKLYGIVGDLTQEQKNQAYVNGFLKEGAKYTGVAAKMTQTYSGSVSALSTQFNNLKVNLGSILSHVLTPIINVLNIIITKINTMAKTWADALNKMFHTKTPADFFTDNSGQIVDSVTSGTDAIGTSAAGAAKKILRATAKFDELNKISSSISNAGGSSTSSTNVNTTTLDVNTEEAETKLNRLNDTITRLKENLLNAWNNSGFGDFVNNHIKALSDLLFNNILPFFSTVKDSCVEWWGIITEGWKTYIAPVFKNIKDRFNDVMSALIPGMQSMIRTIGKMIENTTIIWKEIFSPFVSWLLKNLMPVLGFIIELISNMAHIIGLALVFSFQSAMEIFEQFMDDCRLLVDKIVNIKDTFLTLKDIVVEVFKAIPETIKTAINGVITMINHMINQINSLNIEIPNPFGEPTNIGFNIPNIPMLANGGYVGPNSPQLAVIGDNRHYGEIVANDKQLENLGNKIINGVLQGVSGSGSNQPIYLSVQIGEDDITNIVSSSINRYTKRTGKRII
jgi:hypothetical protein